MRDSQKKKVYRAEWMVQGVFDNADLTTSRSFDFFGSALTLPEERKFGTLKNLQDYVDKFLDLSWVRNAWPLAGYPVEVRERKGQTKAHYLWIGKFRGSEEYGEIAIPLLKTWALRETVLLHEIAHHLTREEGEQHGPVFVGTMRILLSEIVGPEAGLIYTWACSEQGAKLVQDSA